MLRRVHFYSDAQGMNQFDFSPLPIQLGEYRPGPVTAGASLLQFRRCRRNIAETNFEEAVT
jgi:hypothetical protein